MVTDVGSTKRAVVAAHDDSRFVGGHPLAGAETAGVEHARADLFDGATWYLTPTPTTSGSCTSAFTGCSTRSAPGPWRSSPEAHDTILATVSHLPHVLANVLVSQARGRSRPAANGSPPPARASATPPAWPAPRARSGPTSTSPTATRWPRGIDDTIVRLSEFATRWRRPTPGGSPTGTTRAADDRRRLLEAQLAGGPLFELRASVPNRPGVVAQLALELGRAGVNITDMALYPAPDMSEGVVALWIAGEEQARACRGAVGKLGFPVARA